MKKILVIGATSLIAEHCARIWAKRGDSLFLVGRDHNRLDILTSDLSLRGASEVQNYVLDISKLNEHLSMLEKAATSLNGIDIVLIAHGNLSDQTLCQNDVNLAISEIELNALSVISLLTHLANKFEKKNSGVIAVLSSVAGDRGRSSNYVYGSAKAMLTCFTSGLRQRLHYSNVSVLTIKPAYIDTPMTANYKKGILWRTAKSVAPSIVKAIDLRRDEIYVPKFWWIIMTIIRLIPTTIFKRLNL